jgi:hypothetical protein
VIAVPGQTPTSPVISVAPVLVRVVAPSPPNDLARPIKTRGVRLSIAYFCPVGAALERELRQVANNARKTSLLTLKLVDVIVIDLVFGFEVGIRKDGSGLL